MQLFRRLALGSTVATFLLVTIGGLVRATKSGLGCGTNWPHCPGEVTRALIIELAHRTAAGIVVILLAALAVAGWRNRQRFPGLFRLALVAFALVLFQAVLGAIVVWLELEAGSVVLHLATAMALLAVLVYVSVSALALDGKLATRRHRDISRRSSFAAASVLVVLIVGSYLSGQGDSGFFGDWPLMGGRVVPDLSFEPAAIHFLHRVLAALVAVVVAGVSFSVIRRKRELRLEAKLAHSAAGLYLVEILIGAFNAWTELNPFVVTAHLAAGSLVWVALVGLAAVSHPAVATAPGRRRLVPATLAPQGEGRRDDVAAGRPQEAGG